QHNLAAILITHFNKSVGLESIHRVSSGVAMVAVVRIAWAFIQRTEDNGCMMLNAKSNVSAHNAALMYTIGTVKLAVKGVELEPIKVKWGSSITANFAKVLADSEKPELQEMEQGCR